MDINPKSLWGRDGVQLVGFLLVAGLVAVLFSTGNGTATVDQRNPTGRKPMAEIASKDLNGNTWNLADHKGEVVLVNFWASWCPPCREETPGLVNVAKKYRDTRFEVVGVSMDDDVAPVRQFVREFGVPYPVVIPSQDPSLSNAVQSLPTSFLVDHEGRVAKVYVGAVSERQLRADVERLVSEP